VKALRDQEDLFRAARAVAEHFQADRVIIVGSQAILLDWPDAPEMLKNTPEIDIYPENNRAWEAAHPGMEASEEISALFGTMSQFEDTFGFYLDGVDERTAQLPHDWMDRARTAAIDVYGRSVTIVCPAIEDVAVSKLLRFAEKDLDFVKACVVAGRLSVDAVLSRLLGMSAPAARDKRLSDFLSGLNTPR
jgi:hypothetical protein